MLVLTRKLQEQISIGNDITITVLRLKGNTVRIGIEAPDDVRVVRGELPRFDQDTESVKVTAKQTASRRPGAANDQQTPRESRPSGLKPMMEHLGRRALPTHEPRDSELEGVSAGVAVMAK